MSFNHWRSELAILSIHCRAHFRKEFHLQTSTVFSLFGKLVVGPIISLLLTGLIYHGVFRAHPDLVLAGLTRESYLHFICLGFLFQNFLGSGYYGFSTRLLTEWNGKTLSLIWMAPSRRLISFLSLNSVEYSRLVITLLLLAVTGLLPIPSEWVQGLWMLLWLSVLFGMGLLLGFFRACVQVLDWGHIDTLDQIYLLTLFAACPYLPLELLPDPLKVVSLANPLFHFLQLGKKIVENSPVLLSDLLLGSLCPLLVFLTVWTFWRSLRVPLRDKSFS